MRSIKSISGANAKMEAGSSSVRGERMPMTMVQASVKNGPRRGRIKNKQISFWNEINQFINLYVIPYPIKKIINNLKTCYFFFLIAENLFQFAPILLPDKISLLILIQNRFSYKIFSKIMVSTELHQVILFVQRIETLSTLCFSKIHSISLALIPSNLANVYGEFSMHD